MQRKALADALAGVVATLVSLWTFYPMDAYKTRIQAGVDDASDGDNLNATRTEQQNNNERLSVASLFRGLPIKSVHAASSSFCYFYLYSWIVSYWTARGRKMIMGSQPRKMTPAARLALSAIAAMLNTVLTLPLDVLASQQQAKMMAHIITSKKIYEEQEEEEERKETETDDYGDSDVERAQGLDNTLPSQYTIDTMERVWKELERSDTAPTLADSMDGSSHSDVFHDSREEAEDVPLSHDPCDASEEEQKSEGGLTRHRSGARRSSCLKVTIHSHDPSALSRTSRTKKLRFENTLHHPYYASSATTSTKEKEITKQSLTRASYVSLCNIASLWKGLNPSLLLCSNPSIHYTVFDMAKTQLLQRRTAGATLSMLEAFLLGLVAKFVATIATYPLIRAKVMLMVLDAKHTHNGSMVRTLLHLLRQDGVMHGWYKGCSLQLFHTVLKSALLMTVKERIERTTYRLLLPPPPSSAKTLIRVTA